MKVTMMMDPQDMRYRESKRTTLICPWVDIYKPLIFLRYNDPPISSSHPPSLSSATHTNTLHGNGSFISRSWHIPCSEGEGAEATPSLLRAETHSSLVGGRCVPTSFRIHKFLTATIMGARPLLLYSLMLVSMQL